MSSIKERMAALELASKNGSFCPGRGPDPTGAGYVPGTPPRRKTDATPDVDAEEGGGVKERQAALDAAYKKPIASPCREAVVTSSTLTNGFRPAYGSASTTPVAALPTAPLFGPPIASGWLKKSGKGLKAKVYTPHFCTLHADPAALACYIDETSAAPRLVLELRRGATFRCDGSLIVLHTQAEDVEGVVGITTRRVLETRLEADSAEEAISWVNKLEAIVA